uniref:Tetratricopeptide repeat protein n=1 Tax=Thermus islandicus TaxID=540988 RepID=A0A7C2FSQ9_9DEIN
MELARQPLDVLHCPDFIPPFRRRCPAVITVHDLAFLRWPEFLTAESRRYYNGQIARAVRSAEGIVAVSTWTKRDLAELLDVAPERVTVIHHGLEPFFRPQPQEAAEAFRKAAALRPTEEAYLGLAAALAQAGKAKEAAEALRQGLAPERSPAYRLALAQALYAAGDRAEAVPVLYGLLNQDPKRAEAWELLARILAEEGLKGRALRELDRGLAQVEGKARARLLLRKALLSEAPEPLLREAYALDPSLWEAGYLLGQARLRAGEAKEALSYLLSAYRTSPEPPVALALAGAYLRLKDYRSAYRYADEAGPPGAFLKAQAAYALGRKEEALRLLEGAGTPEAQALKGAILLEMGRPEEAVALLRPLYEAGRDPQVGGNLAAGLVALGRFGEAELILREVLARAPKEAAAWYNLGLALRGLGREGEADRAFRQAAALGSAEAQALLRR